MIMVTYFLSGMTAALFITAAIFFLKFWTASKNRFFGFFAISSLFLALERIVTLVISVALSPASFEYSPLRGWAYLLRLLAFLAIFFAILDRNRSKLAQRKALRSRSSDKGGDARETERAH
jgi:hypothetical protein